MVDTGDMAVLVVEKTGGSDCDVDVEVQLLVSETIDKMKPG